ncbi:MAG TPA: CoA transferase, partial [Ilumatobacteraceae bacterium]|nr:CoA transferase [Ilumatobacteraceae bacterium]
NSDMGNGIIGAIAILIGLLHREITGRALSYENPHLNASMVHVAHIVRTSTGDLLGSERLDPMQYGFSAFDRLYQTADGWVCVAAHTARERLGLARFAAQECDDAPGSDDAASEDAGDEERIADQVGRRC